MMTQLYLVEGLPCSGKSTVSGYVADRLAGRGRNVVCVDEGSGNHPADYENHAYVTGEELAAFPPGLRERVRTCADHRRDGYVVPLAQFGGMALEKLMPYKLYDSLPWEVEMPVMLDKWKSFAERVSSSVIYVFNCVFLQNPMCETMMRFGLSEEESFSYISAIAERIAPLDPAVIYLKNDDISQSVMAAAQERAGWLEEVIRYHMEGEYGKSIDERGFQGYIACLEERQRRELAILERLPVKRLILENPQRNWAGAHERITGFIRGLL